MTIRQDDQTYLQPYLAAARAHGAGFGSLLWASPTTQAARFDAIRLLADLNGKSVLDVGCGRADLLEHLLRRGIRPANYVGIEAVQVLADAAQGKQLPGATIVCADFVTEPKRMFVGADFVIFSGSLNTTNDTIFYGTLARALDAAGDAVVFNFLCSPMLAGRDYLFWRYANDVTNFSRRLSRAVTSVNNYLPGDMTVCIKKIAENGTP